MSKAINNQEDLGALLHEQQRMKKSAFVYKVVPLICFLIAAGFIVAGVLSGSLREFILALLLPLLMIGGALPLLIAARRERDLRLRVYENGLS